MTAEELKKVIREIPDFPKEGILFYDITTLLKDARALRKVVDEFTNHYIKKQFAIDKVVSAESRGFIFGSILAHELHAGFVPLRKPGKLPGKTVSEEYELEYGKDKFEVHEDAIEMGDNCLIVDDLLATGGTAVAAVNLVERLGGKVKGLAFLVELGFLNGRKKFDKYDILSLVNYNEGE